MAVMGEWYNGYRFAAGAANDLYNPDMVLLLPQGIDSERRPAGRSDRYQRSHRLRQAAPSAHRRPAVERQLRPAAPHHREGWADSDIRTGFPLEQLHERENFLSLLHYFGLLSIREVREAAPRLGIPNQTVRRLMYGYLRDGYRSVQRSSKSERAAFGGRADAGGR